MLKVPDRRARNLLDLATYVESIDPLEFSMKSWECCICGHYLKDKGISDPANNWKKAADMLGIDEDAAVDLFQPNCADENILNQGPKQAAERIRRFAFAMLD